MYERFTDRARISLQLANQEAQRFNHEYIGTEHMLLGLAKEGRGIVSLFLAGRVGLREIRVAVEQLLQAGPPSSFLGKLPQTPRAKKVIGLAIQNARDLGHNYVGTEHLLLGLLSEQEGVAYQVLKNAGITKAAFLDYLTSSERKDLVQRLLNKADDDRHDKIKRVTAALLTYLVGSKSDAEVLQEIRQIVS